MHDSSASGRTWGSVKDRGKIRRSARPQHLFRSLDVTQTQPATTAKITTRTPRPVRVDRLTETPSPPPVFRWNSATACYSQPHTSLALWVKELEDEEASFSCDSLDPSLANELGTAVAASQSTTAPSISSPSPSYPTARKRWQSPAESRRPSMMGYDDVAESNGSTEQELTGNSTNDDQALVPRFVCWDLPFNSLKSGSTKPLVRVQPRMRSEVNKPAAHKCDLKTQRRSKPNRSRTPSRERGSCAKSGPESMPIVPTSLTQPKTKWTRRINVQQLLPSKARFSSSSLDVRSDGQTRRGTLHRAAKKQKLSTRCMIRKIYQALLAIRVSSYKG